MSELSIKIEEILKEIENCELVASLATDPDTRRLNHQRAEELRELAAEAKRADAKQAR
jgi:hypothetical protein